MTAQPSTLPSAELATLRPLDRALTRAQRSRETALLCARLGETSDRVEAQALRERLILINRVVAESVAARYHGRGIPLEDLRQVGCEGLIKAADRFDASLRNDFLTFAVPTIRGEIMRHFRDRGWAVRPPRAVQEIQTRAARAQGELEQSLGHEPSAGEVAGAVGVSESDYDAAMAASGCFQPSSLDAMVGGDDSGMALGELIVEPEETTGFSGAEARVTLARVLGCLSERDRRILYLRFFEDLTQDEIGEAIGVTQMQVSRLLRRILERLRGEIETAVPRSLAIG